MDEPGRSDNTPIKQEHFRAYLDYHMTVTGNILRKKPWFYQRYVAIDLTAADGGSDDDPGSPLILVQKARAYARDLDLWCCEQQPVMADRLARRVYEWDSPHCRVRILRGDHAHSIAEIIDYYATRHQMCMGLVYFDANGGPLPVETFTRLAIAPGLQMLDFLAHTNAASYKRQRHVKPRYLSEDIAAIGKTHAFVRRPLANWQWTFVHLTNFDDAATLGRWGFVNVATRAGRDVLTVLNLSHAERQPPLPLGENALTEDPPM
ncbi:MAG TPA: hypothetical protein VII06_09450 [Chloroflexota bacterium]|jgi:hypothetical protein